MKVDKLCALLLPALLLVGCGLAERIRVVTLIKESLAKYHMESPKVNLGDSKERVLEILEPTQVGLGPRWRRPPEMHTVQNAEGGTNHIEIIYYRTGLQHDGLLTDDELTPYVFKDGVLTAVGWTVLGGRKTFGKVQPKSSSVVVMPPLPPPSVMPPLPPLPR